MSQDYDELFSKLTAIESASKTLKENKYLNNYNFSENQLSHSTPIPDPQPFGEKKKQMDSRNIKIAIIIGISLAVLGFILAIVKWYVVPKYKEYQTRKSILPALPSPPPPEQLAQAPAPAPEKKTVTFAKPVTAPQPPHRVRVTPPPPPERKNLNHEEVQQPQQQPHEEPLEHEQQPETKGSWSTAIDWDDYE